MFKVTIAKRKRKNCDCLVTADHADLAHQNENK